MRHLDPRVVLWTNVEALMQHHYGRENLTRLAREAHIGPGTCTRIKEQETSVGIDVVDRVAQAFGLRAWQLLVPGLQASEPPTLAATREERELMHIVLRAAENLARYKA